MFLDDELEAIYTENGFNPETSFRLLKACLNRIPKPDQVRPTDYFNEIRKIEGSWKLFCKRHGEFEPDGFRKCVKELCADILTEPVLKQLHWN